MIGLREASQSSGCKSQTFELSAVSRVYPLEFAHHPSGDDTQMEVCAELDYSRLKVDVPVIYTM